MQDVSAEHKRNTKTNTVLNANSNTHADADTEMNIAETKDQVGTKSNAAAGISSNTVLNICTKDDPDPVKQQQENPQSITQEHTEKHCQAEE